jgi:hypothetical protein
MIVLRLRCDSPQKFVDWAKANSLLEEREADALSGQTLFNSAGFAYYEIGAIIKTPAVYSDGGSDDTPGVLVTPAEVIVGHHVDCRFSDATEDRLTQGKEQTELKTITREGEQVEVSVLKPASDRVTLTAVEGVSIVAPATPSHEWC